MYSQNDNPWQNQDQSGSQPVRRSPNGKNKMTSAAFVCALLSILTIFTIAGPFVFGSLAIMFALLSRGSSKKMPRAAKGHIILSLVAIVISIVILLSTVLYIATTFGSVDNFYNYYIETLENEYGFTDEMLEDYGIDPDMFDEGGADTVLPESTPNLTRTDTL